LKTSDKSEQALTAVAQEKRFPTVLLLVSLLGCYTCTQHQQRPGAFFGNTNSGEKKYCGFILT
jgi:hypothetical protein